MKNNVFQLLDVINIAINNAITNSSKTKIIIGVSGGIDSCLVLYFLKKYFNNIELYPYYLPIEDNSDLTDIKLIEQDLNISINHIDLTNWFNNTIQQLNINNMYLANNIKPKLRSIYLYNMALKIDGLVVSCLNYDEYYLGYFTKFGDSNGDIYPLINLTKEDIITLSYYLGLPSEIINKPPSAGLYVNQTDESEFCFSYKDLDNYLNYQEIDESIITKIEALKKKNHHKRVLDYLIKNNYRKD